MIALAIAVAVALVGVQPEPESASATHTQVSKVMSFARNQIGKPYRWGTEGLRRYDCSGLVYRTFKEAGLLKKIGGRRATARWYFRWFRDRGLVTRNPKKGDLVAWGRPVSHIGIFAGYNSSGSPIAISALYRGVSKHRVRAMNIPLKAYLRVRLQR
jgi:cell wall-associated NlpC family hydrolase